MKAKKTIAIALLAIFMLAVGIGVGILISPRIDETQEQRHMAEVNRPSYDMYGNPIYEFDVFDDMVPFIDQIFDEGIVRDEEVAIEIATIIFESVFGPDFNHRGLPLLAAFDSDDQVWLVRTQLPEDVFGREFHLILNKRNAEVIAIWI